MQAPVLRSRALERRRLTLALAVVTCAAVIALVTVGLDSGEASTPEVLFGGGGASLHEGDISADVDGLSSLRSQVDAEVGENAKLSGQYKSTFKKPCLTGLRGSGCTPKNIDNYLENINKATEGDPDEGCCGDEDDGASDKGADNGGDISIGAVVKMLEQKFRKMKQNLREIRADYYKGAPREMTIMVRPRGPRGFTGPPGINGGGGPRGEDGAVGEVGPVGQRGYTGPQGPTGRKGVKGMEGSIGEAGEMGPTGPQGKQGNPGFPGPPGSKGLPGAAGVMGANGKDGPPGPPGMNGPEGPPGVAGDQGNPGAPGAPGKAGPAGTQGFQGQSGKAGLIGPTGPDGPPGQNGVGPPKAGPVKKAGTGTWGPMFLKSFDCKKLGIEENLGGECKPLCDSCDSMAGFMLVNNDGLRYKDKAFDDNNYGAGSTQAKNVCMLARYGNKGKMTVTPDSMSYMVLADTKVVKKQVHWYGSCKEGDLNQATCCTNSAVMSSGFDFMSFATGGQCAGDYATGVPTSVLFCVFNKAAFIRQSRPAGPPAYPEFQLKGGQSLLSNGKVSQMNMLSENGMFSCQMQRNGNFVVYRQGGVVLWETKTGGQGEGPYRASFQTDGNFVIYDKNNKVLWNSATFGKNGEILTLQNDGNLVIYDKTNSALWSSKTSQTTILGDDVKLQYDQAVCVGTACMTGALFSRMMDVASSIIESGTGTADLQCRGGPDMETITVDFKTRFAKPPKVYLNIAGIHDCQNGNANFRGTISLVSVDESRVKFKIGTWGDTRLYDMQYSYMAIGPELVENVQNLQARAKKVGDDSRGIMCLGRYCAGESMIDRLNTMANAHIQTGRYIWGPMDCVTGGYDKRRINFERAFVQTPLVITSIFHYDLCHFGGYNRVTTNVESTDANGFTSIAQTWADTRLHSSGIEWMAIDGALMVRSQQYFPIVPEPIDTIASQMCFGTTCLKNPSKWNGIMKMANWRFESQAAYYQWSCNHHTATMSLTFAEAFEEPPEVQIFIRHFDECGFTSFKYTLTVGEVTTAGFTLKLYGYAMYSIGFHWVAYPKDLKPPPGQQVLIQPKEGETEKSDIGDRSIFYLDRQTVDCGALAITEFKLNTQNSGAGTKINYVYKCAKGAKFKAPETRETLPQDDGGGQLIYLDRLNVNCGPNKAISKFHLARKNNKVVYEFSCVEPVAGMQLQCQAKNTDLNDADGGGFKIQYLDRHGPSCTRNEVMQQFKLSNDGGKIQYKYTCCEQFERGPPPAVKPEPPKSMWLVRVYGTNAELTKVPDFSKMNYMGEKIVSDVEFPSYFDMRNKVGNFVPRSKFAWNIYGRVQVEIAGEYQFCSKSDDGSKLWVDGALVVDNDGGHGQPGPSPCSKMVKLNVGEHSVLLNGFQNDGDVYQDLTWKGPDTLGKFIGCANEGGTCTCPNGVVRYGANIDWLKKDVVNTMACTVAAFGKDPAFGTVKRCECALPEFVHPQSVSIIGAPAMVSSTFKAGDWPAGWCYEPDATCVELGIKENMCGKCIKTATGFKLENVKAGLRWGPKGDTVDGKSFDDNMNGKGTNQAKNICILAKYGNKPAPFKEFPTSNCEGVTQGGISDQTHWYGNCNADSKREKSCCSNAKLMEPGQDWANFAVGNDCGGDKDKDNVLGSITCEFASASDTGTWPTRACYPRDQTCIDLGVTDNLCGKCEKTATGYKLVNKQAGLRYAGASFDDNENGEGSNQAKNVCILSKYGNKGVVKQQPLDTCAGTVNAQTVADQVHWYGNCRKGSVKQKDCCSNAFVIGSYNDWGTFAKGNACQGDDDKDQTLGELTCAFDEGGYHAGKWPLGWCQPLDDECKKLGVKENLCGKCEALPGGGFKLSETKAGLRFSGMSFDDNQNGEGSYQAMNICILARYGNGGAIQFNPTTKCAGSTVRGPADVPHWFGNCQKDDMQKSSCCSNAALLDSRFEWTNFGKGNSCQGDDDLDAPLGEVKCYFESTPNVRTMRLPQSQTLYTSWSDGGTWATHFLDRQTVSCEADPLASFRFGTSGGKLRYCSTETREWQAMTTSVQDDGDGDMKYLDRLDVNCGKDAAISKFHYARRPGGKQVYEYSCVKPKDSAELTCRDEVTPLNDESGGGKRIMFLDRHGVDCRQDEVIQEFKLNRDGGRMQYKYKCCKIVPKN